jgi:hypothetical protein
MSLTEIQGRLDAAHFFWKIETCANKRAND